MVVAVYQAAATDAFLHTDSENLLRLAFVRCAVVYLLFFKVFAFNIVRTWDMDITAQAFSCRCFCIYVCIPGTTLRHTRRHTQTPTDTDIRTHRQTRFAYAS